MNRPPGVLKFLYLFFKIGLLRFLNKMSAQFMKRRKKKKRGGTLKEQRLKRRNLCNKIQMKRNTTNPTSSKNE